ncbi:putative gustatory receptor 28b [Thrips palmi]|uniref:Gustatory receptor 28b n=1 Tax=Thrips palmi TaxID=161013 RepID=A0A6P9A253_THRPL|nr:putative gustatory receptor 28b [Thrips palmi]
MAVLRACHSTSAKGNETADLVHDLLNGGTLNEKEAQQLALFSMQTAHRDVAIAPMGLFKMDMAFVLSFCSTVVMYVVMLLQFKTA